MIGRPEPSLFDDTSDPAPLLEPHSFTGHLRAFTWEGRGTDLLETVASHDGQPLVVDTFVNEFWTSRQRAAHSLHEVSYRACFKPQLPRFFIERLTRPGDVVYDPFMGRGTTVLEAALLGRTAVRQRHQSAQPHPRRAAPAAADAGRRRGQARRASIGTRPTELLTICSPSTIRRRCARSARCARILRHARQRRRSMPSTPGFGWSRSTG